MVILGITGTNGSGKGTVVEYLIKRGFDHYSVSGYLKNIIVSRGLEANRDSMTIIGNELRETYGPDYIVEQLFKKAKREGKNCIIESIRTPGEVNFLKNQSEFLLLAVDADSETRYQRIKIRGSEKDQTDFAKFLADEEREMNNVEPFKQNLKKCIEMADVRISNDNTFQDLHKQVEGFLTSRLESKNSKERS